MIYDSHHAVFGPGPDGGYGIYSSSSHRLRNLKRAGLATVCGILLVVAPILNNVEHSRGTKDGIINTFSEKGTVFKTYEGQMTLEGTVSSENQSEAKVWKFSLDNSADHQENVFNLALKLNNYFNEGKKVTINYSQSLWSWPWRSKTNYHVLSVEPMQK